MALVKLLARKVQMSFLIEICTSVSYAEKKRVPMLRGREEGQHDENEKRRMHPVSRCARVMEMCPLVNVPGLRECTRLVDLPPISRHVTI